MRSETVEFFEAGNPDLARTFRELAGRKCYFVPNVGNAGDSLIAAATYQLFRHYGVEPIITLEPQVRGETVILGGGGNLVPAYTTAARHLARLVDAENRVILLPHSIRGNEQLLSSLGPDVTLHCRERVGFEHTLAHATKAVVVLSHDLAIYTDPRELDATVDRDRARREFDEILAAKKLTDSSHLLGRRIMAIRGGAEATFKATGPNHDISTYFRFGVEPGTAELASWMLLEFCRLCSHVSTNRLHVAIACALVGTPTTMFDNSYGKLSGVYEHSLRAHFSDVEFSESPPNDNGPR